MSYTRTDYFAESISICADENGISLTPEQIEMLADAVQGSYENIGQAFHEPSGSPYKDELDEARRELKKERSKINCPICKGCGRLYSQGPVHSSDSQCWKCKGEGRIVP